MVITYKIAMAAGTDAANKQMRKAGRAVWNESDYNLAADTANRLMGVL